MTLTIEVTPETQAQLQDEARQRGLSIEEVAGELLDDLLQDRQDAIAAKRILTETAPHEYVAWEQLKTEVGL